MIKPQLYEATEGYGPNAFCNTVTIKLNRHCFCSLSVRGNTVQHNTIKVIESDCGIVVICSTKK